MHRVLVRASELKRGRHDAGLGAVLVRIPGVIVALPEVVERARQCRARGVRKVAHRGRHLGVRGTRARVRLAPIEEVLARLRAEESVHFLRLRLVHVHVDLLARVGGVGHESFILAISDLRVGEFGLDTFRVAPDLVRAKHAAPGLVVLVARRLHVHFMHVGVRHVQHALARDRGIAPPAPVVVGPHRARRAVLGARVVCARVRVHRLRVRPRRVALCAARAGACLRLPVEAELAPLAVRDRGLVTAVRRRVVWAPHAAAGVDAVQSLLAADWHGRQRRARVCGRCAPASRQHHRPRERAVRAPVVAHVNNRLEAVCVCSCVPLALARKGGKLQALKLRRRVRPRQRRIVLPAVRARAKGVRGAGCAAGVGYRVLEKAARERESGGGSRARAGCAEERDRGLRAHVIRSCTSFIYIFYRRARRTYVHVQARVQACRLISKYLIFFNHENVEYFPLDQPPHCAYLCTYLGALIPFLFKGVFISAYQLNDVNLCPAV